jgi:hypothetical protein
MRAWTVDADDIRVAEDFVAWSRTSSPAPGGDERFNVKKEGGTEPDLWVRLYRLEF